MLLGKNVGNVHLLAVRNVENEQVLNQLVNPQPGIDQKDTVNRV